jgi:hypothetical protein
MSVFDQIDRQFRPKEPVKLECQGEGCDKAGDDVRRRDNMFRPDVSEVLCERCWYNWAPWDKAAP